MSPKVHELKCWPEFFAPTVQGLKPFEYRRDDRKYLTGEILCLREWIPCVECKAQGEYRSAGMTVRCRGCGGTGGAYTGQSLMVRIRYVMRAAPGLPAGYCVLGIGTEEID